MKKYFKHKIKSLLVVSEIVTIHYLELDKHFKHEEELHDFWELVYADKGTAICTANGKRIQLNQGDMLFHKPNEPHSLLFEGGEKTGVFVISFECPSEAMWFFTDKMITLNRKQINFVHDIIETAKKTYDITFYDSDTENMQLLASPTLGGQQIIKNNLEMLLIDVMRYQTETEYGNYVFLQEREINDKLSEEIIKILKTSLSLQLNIDDIAKATSYSKAYIFRQFKKATGKGIMEYFTELKIKEAKKLLRENELSIKGIADALGFDTPNYFSKVFKKHCKVTPTNYKKRIST